MISLLALIQLVCILIPLPNAVLSYPAVFGTARYGRSSSALPMRRPPAPGTTWIPSRNSPAAQLPAAYRLQPIANYPTYYETLYNPYDYLEDYYYGPEQALTSYPVYYVPAARTSGIVPLRNPSKHYYYANDRRVLKHPYNNYYNLDELSSADPVDDLQEEMLQEDQQNEASNDELYEEDASNLPVGQETWYDSDSPDDESVNELFLQNLIMSHMYNDALQKGRGKEAKKYKAKNMEGFISAGDDEDSDRSDYFLDDSGANFEEDKNWYNAEKYDYDDDSDVRELKKLQKQKGQAKPKEKHSSLSMDPNDSNMYINWNNKRTLNLDVANFANKKQELTEHGIWAPLYKKLTIADRKSIENKAEGKLDSTPKSVTEGASSTTTTSTQSPMEINRDSRGGQKEFVLLRPATPVRHPFAEPVLELLSQQKQMDDVERYHSDNETTPGKTSVYDTIKQLLLMENSLNEKPSSEEQKNVPGHHSSVAKRFVTNENSLVNELKQLKKMAT